ncbi:unnamed protein product [Rotaria sordida]|uniref:Transposase domain-containing protein n=1 Tax=Rotaria sordida TaxID=392033 RepID=A0A818ZXB8_9BILA|nr:unnamed protein product [Rotaria sordida]CAF3769298.1 unnamed protein product [Rotaria sordida]CAF3882965.1 unnamed protein product [Rotaria sordida]
MYRFSYKVNQKRRIRQIKRQSVRHIIAPDNNSSDDNFSDDNNEQLLQARDDEQQLREERSPMAINNDSIAYPSCPNYIDDDIDWINEDESEDEYEDDTRPLYNGSSITVTNAIHRITNFYLNINLDKQKVNGLLRLIKHLLPKPNLLPSTLKRMNKLLHHVSSTSTTLLCSDCYHSCNTPGIRSQTCVNPNCSTSFRRRRTTEIIEIVRFDVRSQIQSIMNRNASFINKSQFFPPSDICFGEQYQHMSAMNSNKITLIVHSDGAPIVRSSKKSIWPCFASITEIPPPMREFQSNIIILALWLSKKKPDVNIFLEETVNDLSMLIHNGTSIFIRDEEYKIQLGTQFFVSDLPAKALFCCTTYFNGYSACTFCRSRGIWYPEYNKVLYPYKNNDLTARTHDSYLKAAREAIRKSNGGKEVAVDGIKGLSSLLRIFNYPTQIIYDFMHLVCLGHIPTLINRWCSHIDKKTISEIDNKLQHLCIPHNMKVVFLESITMASQWKAKNSRLFVLHVGVPIMLNHLPILLFSHFVLYSLAIKLLYSPQTKEEILFAERLLDFYCRTASNVHDSSIEIFSLHAHLHLSYQVRQHGGLTHMSAFAFESMIRYIKKKAHGSINLGSQIAHYSSRRKTIEQNEEYYVVIFPCDNSFSVVKSKQCVPAEQDGFVMVQSGGKKYMGFVFETGNFDMCSKAADLLSQKQHEDIESDYEREKENTSSKDISSNVSEKKTFTSLKDVPFSIGVTASDLNEHSSRHTAPNLNMNNVATPIRVKNGGDRGRTAKGWQRTRNEYCPTSNDDTNIASTATASICCTDPKAVSLSSSITDNGLILAPTTPTSISISNTNVRKRPAIDSRSPPRKKKKNKSKKAQEDDASSSDAQSDEDNFIRSIEPIKTPTFNGRRLILISLEEPASVGNDDISFSSSLIFKSSENEPGVDLLKIPGTKDKANLYVTTLIQLMYTMEELVALQPADTYDDNRYILIKGNNSVFCHVQIGILYF